ncbi:MAG TPA: hypothetical protein VJ725_02840 [Thermoanaerobaculia bacterium]|nr:hypothetical protein [Thermoanaerobaculia bacterium]
MKKLRFRCPLAVFLGLALCLMLAPAAPAQELARSVEVDAFNVESMLQELLASNEVTPAFENLGGGLVAMSVPLPEETRERLMEALSLGEDKASTFQTLATGQMVSTPSNPSTLIHAALSDTRLAYNYWVVVLNLGSTVTKKVTLSLSGPGRKFNTSANVTWGGNGIWAVWYNPNVGVGTPGIYTLKATVASGGTVTTRSFAVNP